MLRPEVAMRILVTGGAGFIGSHLADRLVALGEDVVVLDDLSTGSAANVAHLAGRPRFTLRIGSAADRGAVAEAVAGCDLVFHLAAAVGVRFIVDHPVRAIETNVGATEAVLDAASSRGIRVVLASTSEVYGKGERIPFREDDDVTLGPTQNMRWAYACSKALDEWLALAHARERGLPVVVARLFNTVGPRQTGRYGMVLPTFAAAALRGEPLVVHGSGAQTRCFCHVRDTVEALLLLARSPGAAGEVVNVGGGREVAILELARMVQAAASSSSPIVTVPYEEAFGPGFEDMARRVPHLGKLRALIGRVPETGLEEMIADVVADQRARMAEGC
jgi:UDP-glucose 4-epimerase